MTVRMQAAWKPLSLTGRGSLFTPLALVVYAEERRATGPASDMRLSAFSMGSLPAGPPAAALPALPPPPMPRDGARLARAFSCAGLSPASVLRRSMARAAAWRSAQQTVPGANSHGKRGDGGVNTVQKQPKRSVRKRLMLQGRLAWKVGKRDFAAPKCGRSRRLRCSQMSPHTMLQRLL